MLIDSQVEIQVKKLYCISKAVPALPINIEDAARGEIEIEKALQVCLYIFSYMYMRYLFFGKLTVCPLICRWASIKFCVFVLFDKFDLGTYPLRVYVNLVSQWVQAGKQLVRVNQDTRLNFRVLDLRTPANQGIFRVQCQVENVNPHLVVYLFYLYPFNFYKL